MYFYSSDISRRFIGGMQDPNQVRCLYAVLAWNKASRLSSTQRNRSCVYHCFHSLPPYLLALWDSLNLCIDLWIGDLLIFLVIKIYRIYEIHENQYEKFNYFNLHLFFNYIQTVLVLKEFFQLKIVLNIYYIILKYFIFKKYKLILCELFFDENFLKETSVFFYTCTFFSQ